MTASHPFSSRRGRKLRQAKLRSVDYLCEPCRQQGRLVEAVEVHHVVPLHQGGDPFPPLNGLEALCGDHHYERSHGKRRGSVDPKTGLPTGDHWWHDGENLSELVGGNRTAVAR
jgi:5-methylcytosine-specific restriction enzyme A